MAKRSNAMKYSGVVNTYAVPYRLTQLYGELSEKLEEVRNIRSEILKLEKINKIQTK